MDCANRIHTMRRISEFQKLPSFAKKVFDISGCLEVYNYRLMLRFPVKRVDYFEEYLHVFSVPLVLEGDDHRVQRLQDFLSEACVWVSFVHRSSADLYMCSAALCTDRIEKTTSADAMVRLYLPQVLVLDINLQR